MDKLERQLGLLATLLHTERALRASEIQQQVEGYPTDKVAFRRSFERDKDDLRRLGVPLEISTTQTSDGPVDGYRVRKSAYYLHDLDLDADEVVALSIALRLIRLEGGEAQDAIWKLGGATETEDVPELAAIAVGPIVTQLYKAVADAAVVRFAYRGTDREIEPWRLAFRRGQWYLHGWDLGREAPRQFRIDRIDGSVDVDAAGTCTHERLAEETDRQPWEFTSDEEEVFTARLAVDASHAEWVRHHLGESAVVAEGTDGSVELELEVSNLQAFRSLALSLMDAAEVLSPPHARADVIAWLQGQVV